MEEAKNAGKKNFKDNVFTKSVKAGKRTYYFDVKETKKGEHYVTITERKRRYNADGSYKVEKHKIFLYKEDFEEFAETLDDIIDFVQAKENGTDDSSEQEKHTEAAFDIENSETEDEQPKVKNYTLDSFEDLEDLD